VTFLRFERLQRLSEIFHTAKRGARASASKPHEGEHEQHGNDGKNQIRHGR
jgi:hypothetical protein